jgi:thiosulfate reductase cytochrome b subunit
LHTIGAFLLIVFVIAHLYLITTGHTVSSNLKAMITGFEELDDDDSPSKKSDSHE